MASVIKTTAFKVIQIIDIAAAITVADVQQCK
jgi:hypothetical protein